MTPCEHGCRGFAATSTRDLEEMVRKCPQHGRLEALREDLSLGVFGDGGRAGVSDRSQTIYGDATRLGHPDRSWQRPVIWSSNRPPCAEWSMRWWLPSPRWRFARQPHTWAKVPEDLGTGQIIRHARCGLRADRAG